MEWMLLPFRRYADFSGRSRRMEYWMYQVFTMTVYLIRFIPYVGSLVVMVFMFIDGQRRENRFGSDPKTGPTHADIFA